MWEHLDECQVGERDGEGEGESRREGLEGRDGAPTRKGVTDSDPCREGAGGPHALTTSDS